MERNNISLVCLVLAFALAGCSKREPPPAEVVDTNVVVQPTAPQMFPAVLVTFSTNENMILSERYSLGDDIEIRFGPGRLYPEVPDAQALKGSKIYILEEKDSWLRFRASRAAGPTIGWIHKFASIPTEIADVAVHKSDVDQLLGIGIVVSINPEQSDASVSTNLWNLEGLAVQKGIGRSLAYYCAEIRGKSTRWVDIRDSGSGRKIARYSDTMGFSSYQQKTAR